MPPRVRLSARSRNALLGWFRANARPLPWRATRDPYAIWVSEVMLQQTQVATVLPYFERWMARFPTVNDLAEADEQEVLALWQGLGYYRRCRMLQAGARWVQANGIPRSAEEWRRVPGVGKYTAAAIASIAFSEPVPLVDGNVERVVARLTADPSEKPVLHRAAWEWATANLDADAPGDWNQALMELGATICRPREAKCAVCPLAPDCQATNLDPLAYPRPAAKPQTVHLRRTQVVPLCESRVGLVQIPSGKWHESMWEFPEILPKGAVCRHEEALKPVRHTVTHHRIVIEPRLAVLSCPVDGVVWHDLARIAELPMPAAQRRILRQILEDRSLQPVLDLPN